MDIKRDIIVQLTEWKDSAGRKPLLLLGARQVGKSWILKEFGQKHFEHCVYLSFDNNPELCHVFESYHDTDRILKELQLFTDKPIIKGRTLLIFDEIQECEAAFNSLKTFNEDAPDYHIAASGSLLGVSVKKKQMKVPVGQVNILRLYPLTFREFLRVADEQAFSFVEGMDGIAPLPETIFNRIVSEYRRYLVCGGMPEAAKVMLSSEGNTMLVNDTLGNILDMYEFDFSKYASPAETNRIKHLWKSLPSQLAKENKKFLYSTVRTGARAREYEDALLWMVDAGIVHQVYCASVPKIPLSAYEELTAFKLYACDCGLLRQLSGLSPQVVMSGNAGYVEFRGALAENTVLQSIVANTGKRPHYWTSGGRAEVDFLIQTEEEIIPVEVKSESRISGKSLSLYNDKFSPAHRLRISMNNLKQADGLIFLPLPLTDWLQKFIDMSDR